MTDSYGAVKEPDTCTITIKDDDGPQFTARSGTLVSNMSKRSGFTVRETFANDAAQQFTTGGNARGYLVTAVDIGLRSGTGTPTYTVEIRKTDNTHVATLSHQPPWSRGDRNAHYVASSPIHLAAGTTYFVVVDVSGTDGGSFIVGTSSPDEDAGAAAGWSIGAVRFARPAAQTGAWSLFDVKSGVMMMAIHGSAVPASAVAPDAPASLAVQTDSATGLRVAWRPPAADGGTTILDYDVRWREVHAATWTELDDTAVSTATHATVTGLTAGKSYEVQVRAQNRIGAGAWSASARGATYVRLGSEGSLVGNLGQSGATRNLRDRDYRVFFTTGSHADGYTLTGVDVNLASAATSTVAIQVSVLNSDGSAIGTAGLSYLFSPALADGRNTSTVGDDGLDLAADTTYQVVFDVWSQGNGEGDVRLTNAPGVDSGAAAGWSIGDGESRDWSSQAWSSSTFKLSFALKGYAKYRKKPTAPTIDLVRVVSAPTHDSDGDGRNDTYVKGDRILVDVEFRSGEAVEADTGDDNDNVALCVDVGGTTKKFPFDRVVHGGETLRFAYTVRWDDGCPTPAANRVCDADTDGIALAPDTASGSENILVELSNGATVTDVDTGVAADLRYAGGFFGGVAARLKVDGSRDSVAGPRLLQSEAGPVSVNGDTLTATFDKAIAIRSADALMFNLAVKTSNVHGGNRNAYQHPSAVKVHDTDDTKLVLTLGAPVRAGDEVTLSHSFVGDERPLVSKSGRHAAPAFRSVVATNATPGAAAAPIPVRADIAGTALSMVFDRALDESAAPAGSAFRVDASDNSGSGVRRSPGDNMPGLRGTGTAAVTGSTVTVTLEAAVGPHEQALVDYDPSGQGSNRLKGAGAGGAFVSTIEQFKVSRTRDVSAPTLLSKVANTFQSRTDDPWGLGKSKIMLYFDERLDRTSAPAAGDFALSSTDANAVADATVASVAVEDTAVVLTTSHWLKTNIDYTLAYTPGTAAIMDPAGNAVAAFEETVRSFWANRPVLRGAWVDGSTLELDMPGAPLDAGSVPAPSAFALWEKDLVTGETSLREFGNGIVRVWVRHVRAVLELDHPVYPCDGARVFRVSYTAPSTGKLQTADGRAAAGWTANKWKGGTNDYALVTNARHARCADWLAGTYVGSVILRSKRAFATDRAPEPGWFTVKASGGPVTVTAAAFGPDDAKELKLEVSREFGPHETVTVSYTRPQGASGLWDAAGNQLADIADAPVTGTGEPAAGPPLTAEFVGMPAGHDGKKLFSFEIRFDREFRGLRLPAFKAGALTVTNGRLIDVKRVTPGENRRVTVRVRPASAGEVTVALAATADCSAAGAVCTQGGGKLSEAVTATVPGPAANAPATGAPTIAGEALVGGTLTASTAGIADADGLANASFAFQWVSVRDGTGTDIAGATSSSYTLVDADAGAAIRVRVSFTDDAGNAESLVSAATVPVALPPLTAEFHGMPAEHNGELAFSFGLAFSEEVKLSFRTLRDVALQVGNGRATKAKRVAQGENRRWTVTVKPDSFEDVTVSLPATADCSVSGAICTADGRKLSNTVSARIMGPALLSVADAEADEGAGAEIEFTVTLNRAASHTVTVDYATADASATAGEDYNAASGTLTFAAGVLSQTVAVTLLDDAIDEGRETFTLTLSNPSGAQIADGEATGTIINSDHMPKAWTSRFGRTVAVHVVDAVEARLDGPSDAFLQVGGQRLGGPAPEEEEAMAQRLAPEPSLWEEADARDPAGVAGQAMTFRDLLLGSAFHLASDAGDAPGAPRLSAWGRVATSGFNGQEDELSLDGTVTTATLGVDGVWKRWLTGLLLAYSEGDGSFTHLSAPGGDVSSSLTSLHPYVAYTLSDRVRLWGVVGYGSGALQLRLDDERALHTDLSMTMGALGVRGALLQPSHASGFELALRSDVLWMVVDSAAADDLAATTAKAGRLRLLLEGSRPVALAGGGYFTPSLEVGLRHDGGDAETGTGVEVGGSLRYASAWGLSIEASLRALVAHEAQDYTEWGAGGALRFDPGRQGRGFTAAVTPTWGTAASGTSRLWGQSTATGLVPAHPLAAAVANRLDAEFGYGLATLRGRGLLTPYARVALTEGADQAWHLGTRLSLAGTLNLSVEASRRAREGAVAAHELALRANLGF